MQLCFCSLIPGCMGGGNIAWEWGWGFICTFGCVLIGWTLTPPPFPSSSPPPLSPLLTTPPPFSLPTPPQGPIWHSAQVCQQTDRGTNGSKIRETEDQEEARDTKGSGDFAESNRKVSLHPVVPGSLWTRKKSHHGHWTVSLHVFSYHCHKTVTWLTWYQDDKSTNLVPRPHPRGEGLVTSGRSLGLQ